MPEEGILLLDRFSDEVHNLMLALRTRVFAVASQATEVVTDVGYTVAFRYGSDHRSAGQFVYITGFTAHANLGFTDGAGLPDPADVLEGNGARVRPVKFRAVEEAAGATGLEAYLHATLAQAGFDKHIGDGRSIIRLRSIREWTLNSESICSVLRVEFSRDPLHAPDCWVAFTDATRPGGAGQGTDPPATLIRRPR